MAFVFCGVFAGVVYSEKPSVWGRASYGPGGVATEAGVISGRGALAGTITVVVDVNSGSGVASLSVAGPGGTRTSSGPVALSAEDTRLLQELVQQVEELGKRSTQTRARYAGSEAHYGDGGTRSRGRSGGPDGNASVTLSYSVDFARGEVAVGVGAALAGAGNSEAARISTSEPLGALLAVALTDVHNKLARGAVLSPSQPVQRTQSVQPAQPVQRYRRFRRFRRR